MDTYTRQAKEFLRKANARMTISFGTQVKGFPFDKSDRRMHDKYIVRIDRNGKSYRFPFYQSSYDTDLGIRPTCYDVLACVEKYDTGTLADFVCEYGYEIHDLDDARRVERIWRACQTQYKKLRRLFGNKLLDELREIS